MPDTQGFIATSIDFMVALSVLLVGMGILLVFALPVQVDYSYTVQAVVFGVVLTSLLVQAPLLQFLLMRRYTLHQNSPTSEQ